MKDEEDGTSFDTLADEAAGGRFGDIQDWTQAEARWLKSGAHASDFGSWKEGRYLNSEIAAQGIPFPNSAVYRPGAKLNLAEYIPLTDLFSEPKKLRLLEILVGALRRSIVHPDSREAIVKEAVLFVQSIPRLKRSRLILSLAAFKEAWSYPQFVELANEFGKSRTALNTPLGSVVAAFNENPSRRGLLSFFPRNRHSSENLSRLDESAFEVTSDDTPTIRYSIARLRLVSGNWGQADVDGIVEGLTRSREEFFLTGIFARDLKKNSAYPTFLKALCSAGSSSRTKSETAFRQPLQLLSREVSAQHSGLADAAFRASLELPDLPSNPTR